MESGGGSGRRLSTPLDVHDGGFVRCLPPNVLSLSMEGRRHVRLVRDRCSKKQPAGFFFPSESCLVRDGSGKIYFFIFNLLIGLDFFSRFGLKVPDQIQPIH